MSISGLCQICENAEARHRCDRCSSLVCATHYDTDSGLCTECASEVSPRSDGEWNRQP